MQQKLTGLETFVQDLEDERVIAVTFSYTATWIIYLSLFRHMAAQTYIHSNMLKTLKEYSQQ